MSEPAYLITLIVVAVLAALLGAFIMHLRSQKQIGGLRETNAELRTTLDMERRAAGEKIATIEKAREQLSDTFAALSNAALKSNTEQFLKLAQENLKQYQIQSHGELTQRQKAIEGLVAPIKEALEKTETQIRRMEHERKEAYGSLTKHLETMTRTQEQLHGETRNLVQALRRPEVRGQWGEMTLRRLAELAGMVEHCDFYEQEQVQTEEGTRRPDMVVRMPDGREIIVDVKTPLDAYLSAVEAPDNESRDKHLQRHAAKVRERVRELASKAYWNQFKHSPDFVVLFIPGEQFLSSALDHDRNLLEDALSQKVILATPTSFVALLRAVAYGWRQEVLAENADEIRKLGEELYHRMAVFSGYLAKVGSSLTSSILNFNKAVGSFETRVLPGARKFTEMGITAKKPIEAPQQVETIAKEPSAPADAETEYKH